jgi:hypothetical protein
MVKVFSRGADTRYLKPVIERVFGIILAWHFRGLNEFHLILNEFI